MNETDDPIPGLFERTRFEAPLAVVERARALATEYVGKVERLPFATGDSVGAYEILGILGAGGQAVVYEARHTRLDRRVAIKVPRRDVGDRLTREAKLMARLVHPSIVQVVDLSLEGPVPFLILELCEKGSLEDRLEVVSPDGLPLEQVFAVSVSVLEALSYAHAKGVVHRDVKPANVLFDANNNVKVADFGIGTLSVSDELSVSHDLSRLSLLAGTPLYLAPEQENPALRDEGRIDGRADLFSFGKVLFQMLTGASPRTIRPPSRLRPGLPTAWDEFIFKLTEERPERRFQTAVEALAALPELRPPARAPRPAPPTPPPAPPPAALAVAGDEGLEVGADSIPNVRITSENLDQRGFAPLYRAWHRGLDRQVLVRVLGAEARANPRTVERFFREARLSSKIIHPNVVHILDVGSADGVPYMVTEDVKGRTLEELLASGVRQSWEKALRLVFDVAQALEAAHRAGVVHRDLKAESLIVTPEGRVKVGDFGVAKDLSSDMKLTADGAMIGTPLYMAPEIGRVKEIDGRIDIYSLGVVFYYLLTGRQPFRAFSAIEILSAKAHRKIPEPEKIPEPFRRVLGKMLEPDREQRYESVDQLLRDLAALDKGTEVSATEPGLWAASSDPARKEERAPRRGAALAKDLEKEFAAAQKRFALKTLLALVAMIGFIVLIFVWPRH